MYECPMKRWPQVTHRTWKEWTLCSSAKTKACAAVASLSSEATLCWHCCVYDCLSLRLPFRASSQHGSGFTPHFPKLLEQWFSISSTLWSFNTVLRVKQTLTTNLFLMLIFLLLLQYKYLCFLMVLGDPPKAHRLRTTTLEAHCQSRQV